MDNIAILTDSYKSSHWRQYPVGTSSIFSYFESRGGAYEDVVFFGLQYYLKRYLRGAQVTLDKIDAAQRVWDAHLGPGLFNREGWLHILEKHKGHLPISIRAVPEGTPVGVRNALITIENTDPKCFWLTNWLETLLVQTWYGSTVATVSRQIKQTINDYLQVTGDPSTIDFKLHDFGFRGVSSVESAGIGGAAHLVNFKGTDTIVGATLVMEYYGSSMPGFSIPASEHSTITSWGKVHEVDAMKNMLDAYPTGVVACVSDSYDILNACNNIWGGALKRQIMERKGTLVVRPDSGEPARVIMQVLEALGEKFGKIKNAKGFNVLPSQVRVIQGDGVDHNSIINILATMMEGGWSADNIAFGMGGALLQKLNRDTQRFAFKCSNAIVGGVPRDVFKDPATDPGKRSKLGRLVLVKDSNGAFSTQREGETTADNVLLEVFRDGKLLIDQKFDDIRVRVAV